MPQRQPRLGDILDDYCPRERRLTNHAVVAMIGDTIRLTRCTTCDAEHDYKEGKIPRPRKKTEPGALAVPALFVPKRVNHDTRPHLADHDGHLDEASVPPPEVAAAVAAAALVAEPLQADSLLAVSSPVPMPVAVPRPEPHVAALDADVMPAPEEGPVHRQLIRAQLPRHDGQPIAARTTPDFTIRQPTGRQNRFRRGAQPAFQGPSTRASGFSNGNTSGFSNGNTHGNTRGNGPRPAGQPPMMSRFAKRQGGAPGKRSK